MSSARETLFVDLIHGRMSLLHIYYVHSLGRVENDVLVELSSPTSEVGI